MQLIFKDAVIHTHIHTYIHTYVHTYTHTHTYIHTYAHRHTHISVTRRLSPMRLWHRVLW